MRFLKLLLVACMAVGVYHYVQTHHKAPAAQAATPNPAPDVSAQGFVALPPLQGAQPNKVMIIAPENCPKEAGQRAGFLEQALASEGIPASRTASVQFGLPMDGDTAGIKASLDKVMMGELPIVVINGRAKNNPQMSEIEAEFRSNRK